MRRAAALPAAAALALAARLVLALPADADTPAREAAVADLGRRLIAAGPQPADGGYLAVRSAWVAGGLDLGRADASVRAAGGGADATVLAFVHGVCAGGWLTLPADRPRPGDLAVAVARAAPHHARLAMFVGGEDLVAPDGVSGRLRLMRRQDFLADDGPDAATSGPLPLAGGACHVDSALLPPGNDVAPPPGRVALADPGLVAAQIDWASAHPRDAGSGPWHALAGIIRGAATLLSRGLALLVTAALAIADGVLSRSGVTGAAILAAAGAVAAMLSTRFDGRRLHTVLTVALVCIAAAIVLGPGAAMVAAAVTAGLLGGATLLNVPVLGAAGRALWTVAGFVTTVVTGVDDSDHASVGEVLFALVADALVWARPAMVAARIAEVGGRLGSGLLRIGPALTSRVPAAAALGRVTARALGRGLGAAGTVSDAVMLRPQVLARGGRALLRLLHLRAAELPAARVPVTRAGAVRNLLHTAVDLTGSMTWRRGSLLSDLVGHAGSAATWLHADVAAGGHSWPLGEPLLRDIVARIPESRRTAVFEVAFPQVRELATLSHLHSGARTVTTLAGGGSLPTVGAGGRPPVPQPIAPRVTGGFTGPG